mgnify:CR=1 FL=1
MISKNSCKVTPYTAHKEDIEQGDIFNLTPSEIEEYFDFEHEKIEKFIVLSNSCDITNDSIDFLSIGPCINLNVVLDDLLQEMVERKDEKGDSFYKRKEIKKNIKNIIHGLVVYNSKRFFYLPESDKFQIQNPCLTFLDTILIYEIKEFKKVINKKRICTLKNPWKEKLGWAMGNIYNRVALEDYEDKLEKQILTNLKSYSDFYNTK